MPRYIYPGNACQAVYGDQAGDLAHYASTLINESASLRVVTCPIVRDNIGNLNGVQDADVRVRSPFGTELECRLFSYSALGDLVDYEPIRTTSQNVNVLPLDIDISTNGGTYSLECFLPPQGWILGYRVKEY